MIDRYSRPQMKRVWSDAARYDRWLQVEIAICEAWAEQGVIPAKAMERIRRASYSMEQVTRALAEIKHEMNAFLRAVAESVGPESRYIHLGLTSYDVQDNATSLHLVEACDLLEQGLADLAKAVRHRAQEHKHTICMGRTHGDHAEPTTFGLKLLVWLDELRRSQVRLRQAREVVAVGKVSGAVGSHATVPLAVEDAACKRLGLAVAPASTQTLQRDRHAQFVQTLALIGASLEKFATEIRGLQRTEIREVEEPFGEGQAVTTGSSAMPHKRNPELSERVCGLARLLRGYATTALENVALWHERDISHSSAERVILPDACLALDYMLDLFTFVVRGMRIYPERMRQNLGISRGLIFSQRVLLALIDKGLTRQQAYAIVQRNAMQAWDTDTPFRDHLDRDPEVTSRLSPCEMDALMDYGYYVAQVDATFARAGV